MKTQFISLLSVLVFCSSCTKEVNCLERALQFAGDNRAELEAVLTHYNANPKDSLKYRAAVFLIKNMPYHHSYRNDKLAKYQNELYQTAVDNNCKGEEAVQILEQKYGRLNPQEYETVQDAQVITADYLIRNIEHAFFVWQKQAWGKQITFDDFCEQILPYRIKDEPLDDWREVYYNHFQPVLDSLLTDKNDPVEAIQVLWNTLNSKKWVYLDQKPNGCAYSALNLLKNPVGDCFEFAHFSVYVMRALGIPGGMDNTLISPTGLPRHAWNFVPDTLGNIWEFSLSAFQPKPGKQKYPLKGRVYRECFGIQAECLPIITREIENIPPLLRSAFQKDVSADYLHDVSIEVKVNRWKKKDTILFLCTFSLDGWTPVAWAPWKDGKFTFPSVEKDIIYLPAYYKKGIITPISPPCYINQYGIYTTIEPDLTQKQNALISRKYPMRKVWENYNKRIIGGKIQVANDSAFTNPVTLYTITQPSNMLWNTCEFTDSQNYRYIRYLSGEKGRCNMAEVEVFSANGQQLRGKVIGTESSIQNLSNNRRDAVFDGDPLTFYDAVDANLNDAWAGLDLGDMQSIKKVRYLFRNDDNNIRAGDEYELFYWDNRQWQSLGQYIGTGKALEFENVPRNALLWLHNYTRGREERLFVYSSGEQVFVGEQM
ncbi:hypothetical protein FACS1894176_10430 [Bacteroidia bacterium]|nr:hypothetical protein FACS1894176_10430 [Bacteroidia bacterium]